MPIRYRDVRTPSHYSKFGMNRQTEQRDSHRNQDLYKPKMLVRSQLKHDFLGTGQSEADRHNNRPERRDAGHIRPVSAYNNLQGSASQPIRRRVRSAGARGNEKPLSQSRSSSKLQSRSSSSSPQPRTRTPTVAFGSAGVQGILQRRRAREGAKRR